MNLEEQFKKETGESIYSGQADVGYSDKYVQWLEEKLNQLKQ